MSGNVLLMPIDQVIFIVHGVTPEFTNWEENSGLGSKPNVTDGGLRSLLLNGYFLVCKTFRFFSQKRYGAS
jgi:hypothetical protein